MGLLINDITSYQGNGFGGWSVRSMSVEAHGSSSSHSLHCVAILTDHYYTQIVHDLGFALGQFKDIVVFVNKKYDYILYM